MHKARVFASALGFTKENASALEDQLLAGLKGTAATERKSTEFGRTNTVDIPVSGPVGGFIVRTGWHIPYRRRDGHTEACIGLCSEGVKFSRSLMLLS